MVIDIPGYSKSVIREKKLNRILEEDVSNTHIINGTFKINININEIETPKGIWGHIPDIKGVLYNEWVQLYNKAYSKVFNKIEIKKIKTIAELSKLLETYSCNLVTNGLVGSYLQDLKESKPYFATNPITSGRVYRILDIHKLKVYVDPFMRWDDKSLYFIKKPFFYFGDYTMENYQEPTNLPSTLCKCDILISNNYIDCVDAYKLDVKDIKLV